VSISGITIRHALATFMDDYEVPSGGDWSIHRYWYMCAYLYL
jgi:hypothetical protein